LFTILPRAAGWSWARQSSPASMASWLDRRAWIGVLDGSVRARRDEEEETSRQLRAATPDDSYPVLSSDLCALRWRWIAAVDLSLRVDRPRRSC
jgi:hypothetical protein